MPAKITGAREAREAQRERLPLILAWIIGGGGVLVALLLPLRMLVCGDSQEKRVAPALNVASVPDASPDEDVASGEDGVADEDYAVPEPRPMHPVEVEMERDRNMLKEIGDNRFVSEEDRSPLVPSEEALRELHARGLQVQ